MSHAAAGVGGTGYLSPALGVRCPWADSAFVTSAKEVMFSSAFVCLFAC